MGNKKGAALWDFIIMLIIGIAVLALALVIYFIITKDMFGLGSYIKDLFRFGV